MDQYDRLCGVVFNILRKREFERFDELREQLGRLGVDENHIEMLWPDFNKPNAPAYLDHLMHFVQTILLSKGYERAEELLRVTEDRDEARERLRELTYGDFRMRRFYNQIPKLLKVIEAEENDIRHVEINGCEDGEFFFQNTLAILRKYVEN